MVKKRQKEPLNYVRQSLLDAKFPEGAYQDVAGLCRVATTAEIEAQGWSLNPGRYVGVAERPFALILSRNY